MTTSAFRRLAGFIALSVVGLLVIGTPAATAQETTVTMAMEDGTPRITQVVIKGENDTHIFQ